MPGCLVYAGREASGIGFTWGDHKTILALSYSSVNGGLGVLAGSHHRPRRVFRPISTADESSW